MENDNPVVQLCIAGTQAEYQHKLDEAKAYYEQAWQIQSSDYEACIAAHYMARFQEDPRVEFDWNQKALDHALACEDAHVNSFLSSLYLNMGKSYEKLGDSASAQKFYNKASQLGFTHQMDVE